MTYLHPAAVIVGFLLGVLLGALIAWENMPHH
jgi:hypothetical protein